MLLLVLSALLMLNVHTARVSADGTGTSVSSGQMSSGSIGSVSQAYSAANAVMIISSLFIFIDLLIHINECPSVCSKIKVAGNPVTVI